MGSLKELVQALPGLLPLLVVLCIGLGLMTLVSFVLRRREQKSGYSQTFSRQIIMLLVTASLLVVLVLVLPVSEESRGHLLSLLGILLTAVIALSSTTFVSNAMAGLMTRSVGAFRPGDFIRVGDQFGRVTERGLFHTEIQTEDRDLTTIPNMYLVSHPVTVVRSSGTIITANVSLGYDIPHHEITPLLLKAAEKAELEDPFVRVMDLGDFAVTYRVAGFLGDVKQLLSVRSSLRTHMLDCLHEGGIEIASPSIMIQRPIAPDEQLVPAHITTPVKPDDTPAATAEDKIFDKAEKAAELEDLRREREELAAEIKELEQKAAKAKGDEKSAMEKDIAGRKQMLESLGQQMAREKEENGKPDKPAA